MAERLLEIHNGEKVAISRIPYLPFTQFHDAVSNFVRSGGNIVQFFAAEDNKGLKLWIVLRNKGLFVTSCEAPKEYHSLTLQHKSFHMFERELAEQFGIRPLGHPWLKALRYHRNYGLDPDIFGNDYTKDIPGNYPYYSIDGEQVHEVGVGPVHAGIIEPGHFRFNCSGETVLNLEIQLGYQHRGVERLLITAPVKRLPIIIEGIAGDSAVTNSICAAEALEALSTTAIENRHPVIRTLALELERLANHIGDLGALSGDVAFLPPAAYFGRIRGEFLNLLLLLAGNRFGKNLIRPGGIVSQVSSEKLVAIQHKCRELTPQIVHVSHLLLDAPSVLTRFENTGTVTKVKAETLGLVGTAGRASGLEYDVRNAFPTEFYTTYPISAQVEGTGDVLARAKVRAKEIIQSLTLIGALPTANQAVVSNTPPKLTLTPDAFVVTLAEGWRGELSHCLVTDDQGKLISYKIKDPSFHNWNGLAVALRNQEISDFPLCNKSFNLSYCGFDL